ncbi:MAG: MxaK protein [Burkholderiaceae bacterium]
MSPLTRRRALRLTWLGLGLTAAWAGYEALSLKRTEQLNAHITAGTAPSEDAAAPPELIFALAHAQAASGAHELALNRYGALHGSTLLGQAARYNSANLLLRQGMALHASGHPGRALAMIELAKEAYREVLRDNPDDWPARYNLERAQRLVPDPDEADEEPPQEKRSAERAATTMRGYSPGLP